ncbi:MAG: 50S ribosomal protein L37ae [Euryarchaeota archaeon]|nr:50S ribosomal protein L37ae [Euryarchaeota archaeon]MDE1836166.1 50S ribosomal protein L37ae [Euryarchaeota archaeon]MDE1881021.1 50S ribosomal protein L37ae [Euryarchaeota archaeon]MDE2045471.1 50S ribosomal protein L37ae [Thermoplasmata archaeon]
MSKRTKKVGITGWMGPRYGIRIRRRTQEVERGRIATYSCPKCSTVSVRRIGSGLWRCSRCERTFASDAYAFRPAPSIFRVEEESALPSSASATGGKGKVKGAASP